MDEKQKEEAQLASWSFLIDTLTPEEFKEFILIYLGTKPYKLKER